MSSKVATFAATPDPMFSQHTAVGPVPPEREVKAEAESTADLRLVIEEDQASGTYVYKTINRRTGEVVLQLPRAEVLKLREDVTYAAGAVIRTKA